MRKLMMPALLAGSMIAAPRGVFAAPRADATHDPKALLAQINRSFEEFKVKNDEQINARFKDVVSADQIEKINDHLNNLQSAMEEQARKVEAASLNGPGDRKLEDAEYTKAFASWFRTDDLATKASLKKVPDTDGGFLAPAEWDRTITDRLKIVSPAREVFAVQTVSGSGFKKTFNMRGQASGWVGETAPRLESNTSTFGSMNYSFGELYANPAITQQLLDDAEVDMEAWLAGEVDLEFAQQEGVAFISGDGVNKPTGILTYVTGAANATAHPFGSIKLTASGNASGLQAGAAGSDTVMNLVYGLPTELAQAASFIANRNTIKAIRLLKDGQGNYLWQPSYQAGQPATVAGYAIREYAAMPDIAANAVPLLFGDLKRAYGIFDRLGVRIIRDEVTNKPFVHFYTVKRVGGGLLNPEFVKGMKIQLAAADF
jgi:HK97 family phage major capsid protein